MPRCLTLALAIVLATPAFGLSADKPPPAPLKVRVDTTEVPDLAPWGTKAKGLVEKWHPLVSKLLASDGFTPPSEVQIVFKKDMKGIAFAQGNKIVIAADWIRKHPDDEGMVVHELTHIIQGYPPSRASWLVEGIADYIRFFHFEPKTKIAIDPRRASYRDGYRTTAKFLAWVEANHDKRLVSKLNKALRKGKYTDNLFKSATSKTLDELWAEFLVSEERK